MESLETPLRIFVPSPDLPTIRESPETPTFGIPMMLVGIGIAGIVVVATGIFLWMMFTTYIKFLQICVLYFQRGYVHSSLE